MEAIVGAALLSGGEKLAFSVAKILGFDVPKTCDWFDVVSYTPCKVVTPQEAREKETLEGIMKIIGVSLDKPKLLVQAMVSNRIFSDSCAVEMSKAHVAPSILDEPFEVL